ncbi:MAG: hypothetical protein GWO20_16610 [Candidatus Korarchaeota archaeon]|nr:hypothetical protein [Candidatus Korarchaeota archaeon]NIU85028.1 hypothetical protein [Candidatus Thorarchaeota archaeon]NIW15053.1 hypothetical protein [Candidatus Thorarchaeota archaeon]NIW53063.1 hypothetical protein [Candidatus Korarchaeota archaeon]
MRKKIISICLLIALIASPLTGIFLQANASYDTVIDEKTNVKQANQTEGNLTIKPGGTIRLSMGTADLVNPTNQFTMNDEGLITRVFDELAVTKPGEPYNMEGMVPLALENYKREIVRNKTVTLRNGTSSADIPGWGGTLGGPTDMSVWALKLREGMKWHDGEPVTTDDLIFSFQFQQWVAHYGASANLDQLYGPQNMDYITAEKINDTAVRVYVGKTGWLKSYRPLNIWLWPKHIYENAEVWSDTDISTIGGETFNIDNWWDPGWGVSAETVVGYTCQGANDPLLTGSGPWIPVYWDATLPKNVRTFRFKRYEDYYWNPYNEEGNIEHPWIPPEGNIDTIYDRDDPYLWGPYAKYLEYSVILTSEAGWEAFSKESIDYISGRSAIQHLRELRAADYTVKTALSNDPLVMDFNCNKTYLTRSDKFRRAVDWAVDKNKLIQLIEYGFGKPTSNFLSSIHEAWWWEPPSTREDPMPQKAREMVAELDQVDDTGGDFLQGPPEAEWTDESGNIQLTIDNIGAEYPYYITFAQSVKEDLEAAGIKVKLRTMTSEPWVNAWLSPDHEGTIHGWNIWGPVDINIFRNTSFWWTIYRWDHPDDFYNAVEEFNNAEQQENAIEPAKKAQELLYNYTPMITFYMDVDVYSYNPKWEGLLPPLVRGITAGHSLLKWALVESRPGETAEGFNRPQYDTVSGTITLQGEVVERVIGDIGDLVSIRVDDSDPDYQALENVTEENATKAIIVYNYTYELDTPKLSNGWHTVHVTGFLVSGEVFGKWWLSIYVDNPVSVPFTQRVLPMVALSSVIVGVIVGAAVYMVMRRKKPRE